ncbi:MAG: hypothetical protein M1825_003310 [Sarcosagium campestre]|nr:MAG: hypothetical protein M1825_003310 [Sarcosagium campestre]
MPAPSFTPFIRRRAPWLIKYLQPVANWYLNLAGYRQLGLRYDDLLPEESEEMQKALKRLPPKEAYDRVFRLRRAFQCSLAHQLLPKEEHTKPEDDVPYLSKIIDEIETEEKEREDLAAMVIKKRKA